MCRFIFLVFLLILFICGIGSIFGENVIVWIILIGFVGSSLGLLLLPRRGEEHAFANLYRRLALITMIFIGAIIIGGIYLLVMIIPEDAPEWASTAGIIGLLSLSIFATYLVLRPYYPATYGKKRIRTKYREVFDSIKRYKKKGDQLEDYFPILSIEGNHYLLIHYNNRKGSTITPDYLLLDEMGKPVRDELLMKKAIKCKTLAFNTIDYGANIQRAQRIESDRSALDGLRNLYLSLKKEHENIAKHSAQAQEYLEELFTVEDYIYQVVETSIALAMLEAKWAKEHGLGKLTIVEYEQVSTFEEEMRAIRIPLVEVTPQLMAITEPARQLAEVFSKDLFYLPGGSQMKEAILGIADGIGLLEIQNEDIYGKMSEDNWSSWRDRMAWADQVDAGAEE